MNAPSRERSLVWQRALSCGDAPPRVDARSCGRSLARTPSRVVTVRRVATLSRLAMLSRVMPLSRVVMVVVTLSRGLLS